jgi:hypothetical protein
MRSISRSLLGPIGSFLRLVIELFAACCCTNTNLVHDPLGCILSVKVSAFNVETKAFQILNGNETYSCAQSVSPGVVVPYLNQFLIFLEYAINSFLVDP